GWQLVRCAARRDVEVFLVVEDFPGYRPIGFHGEHPHTGRQMFAWVKKCDGILAGAVAKQRQFGPKADRTVRSSIELGKGFGGNDRRRMIRRGGHEPGFLSQLLERKGLRLAECEPFCRGKGLARADRGQGCCGCRRGKKSTTIDHREWHV